LVRHKGLLELTLVLTVVTLLYMPLNALFPLMTLAHFGGDAVSASITELAFGAGMLVGSIAIGTLAARFCATRLIGIGILVVGLMIGASGLLPPSGFWAFAGFCLIMGVSVPLFGAPITAIFQTLIDPSELGRVMSLYMTLAMLVAPIGLLFAGPLAERMGVAPWFALSGALIFLSGRLVWAVPAVQQLDRAIPPKASEPSGEVVVGIVPSGIGQDRVKPE
jgi:DHA3 family macrolide efflux protein-like MFS transporter